MHKIKNLLSQGNTPFYQFKDSNDRTWLMPERNMATAMDLYNPTGRRAAVIKEWFPTLHRLPFADRAFNTVRNKYRLNPEMQSIAKEAFGADNIEYSILGGTLSVSNVITIQFFKGKRILGYGKVTDNPDVEQRFIKEHILLDYLWKLHVYGIPKSLLVKRLDNGSTISLQTSEKRASSHSPQIWTPLHEDFLNEMAVKTAVPVPFLESDFYGNLCELTKRLQSLPEEIRQTVSDSLGAVHRDFGVYTYVLTTYHGNFTPRNMYVNGNRLFVANWENAELSYPPTLDRYHFLTHQYIHTEHLSAIEVYNAICRHKWYDANLFRCYLLDRVYRTMCHNDGETRCESEMLKVWSRLLFYTYRK